MYYSLFPTLVQHQYVREGTKSTPVKVLILARIKSGAESDRADLQKWRDHGVSEQKDIVCKEFYNGFTLNAQIVSAFLNLKNNIVLFCFL